MGIHVRAEEMKVDGFSKLYDLAEHKPFAAIVPGERSCMTQSTGGH
jgi:hypothetical protein